MNSYTNQPYSFFKKKLNTHRFLKKPDESRSLSNSSRNNYINNYMNYPRQDTKLTKK